MKKREKHAVGPAKTNYVRGIADRNPRLGRPCDHVVLLPNGPVTAEIDEHRGKEFEGEAVRVLVEPIAAQAFDSDQLEGRPAIRVVPLRFRFLSTRGEPTRAFESLPVSLARPSVP